jgi:hypothetical protein
VLASTLASATRTGQSVVVTEQLHPPRLLHVDDLRQALAILLDAAEERFGQVIDLDAHGGSISTYWTLSADAAFEMTAHPDGHVTVGDLDDDLLETAAVLRREDDREVILWHDLAHLCGLLGALSYLDLPGTTSNA